MTIEERVASAIRWLWHTTAMIPDYDVARERLALLAGLRVLEYGESLEPGVGRRGGMCWIGDNSLELGQPIVAGGGAARFVDRSGGGMHSVAVQVDDLEATIAHVESCGVKIAARPSPEFCFSDPRDTHGVFFEWASVELDVDPRFGANVPPFTIEPLLEVTHHAFAGAIVEDPLASADLFSKLLGTEVTFERPDAEPDEPCVGVSLGNCTLALYKLPGEAAESTWGRSYERPRTHLLGLAIADFPGAEARLRSAGFGVVRRTDEVIVIDPASTGGVQVALVGDLLPGDPRSAT